MAPRYAISPASAQIAGSNSRLIARTAWSLDVRNCNLATLNLLQIALLDRGRRSADPNSDRALLLCVNGVAGGVRDTG